MQSRMPSLTSGWLGRVTIPPVLIIGNSNRLFLGLGDRLKADESSFCPHLPRAPLFTLIAYEMLTPAVSLLSWLQGLTIQQCAYHTRPTLTSKEHEGHLLLWGTAWEGGPGHHMKTPRIISAPSVWSTATTQPPIWIFPPLKQGNFQVEVYAGSAFKCNPVYSPHPLPLRV